MESKRIDEIKSVIDISAQGIRESEMTGRETKGYYFEAITNAKTSRCLIPKTLLEEWDVVTEKFRKAKRINAVNYSISVIEENTKLKAEINRANGKAEMYQEMADSFCNSNIKLKAEIEQLKILAEEQSKLTIEQFKQIDEQYQEIERLKSTISKMETTTAQEDDLK